MAKATISPPKGVTRSGMAQDSLSSGNLTTALSRPPSKSDSPPATTGSSGGSNSTNGKTSK